jgi:hypothetical protein
MRYPRIYFDLDGVVVNFVSGALAIHGKTLNPNEVQWDFASQIGFAEDQSEFWSPLGFEFWDSLPIHADGLEFFRSVERYTEHVTNALLSFLSSPCDTLGCRDGKQSWVNRTFPKYSKKLFLGSDKSVHADRNSILVDDHDKNVESFRNAGGFAFLVPRPWNSKRSQCVDGKFDPARVFGDFICAYEDIIDSMRGC